MTRKAITQSWWRKFSFWCRQNHFCSRATFCIIILNNDSNTPLWHCCFQWWAWEVACRPRLHLLLVAASPQCTLYMYLPDPSSGCPVQDETRTLHLPVLADCSALPVEQWQVVAFSLYYYNAWATYYFVVNLVVVYWRFEFEWQECHLVYDLNGWSCFDFKHSALHLSYLYRTVVTKPQETRIKAPWNKAQLSLCKNRDCSKQLF